MRWQQGSIKHRLRRLILLNSTIVLVATSATFLIYEIINFKAQMVRNVSTLAAVIADNSAVPLAFNNKDTADKILAALKAEPDILAAAVYDNNGQIFASYPQGLEANLLPKRLEATGYHFTEKSLRLFQPVVLERKVIGTLYLRSSLRGLYQRLARYGGIVAIILACSFVAAFILSTLLQRRISQPILALTHAAQTVAELDDYSIRAPKLSHDEVGVLTDAFNKMLAETQEHQGRLAEQARLLDLGFDAIIVVNAQDRITYWNRGASEMYGFAREEALGQVVNELLKSEFPEPRERIVKRLHRDNRWVGELVHTRKDGVRINVSSRLALDRDAQGNPASIQETNTDITQRRRAEEGLRESQAKLAGEFAALGRLHELSVRLWRSPDLRAALEEMLDAAIVLLGADMGTIQLVNRERHLLEIVAQRGFAKNFLDALGRISDDNTAACGRTLRSGQRTIIEDVQTDPDYARYRETAAAAGYRAIQSTPLLDGDGALLGVFSTHWRQPHRPSETELRKLDLYARQSADFIARVQAEGTLRENEAKKSAMLESALDCIITMDQEGRIAEFNAAAEETFGWRRKEIVGKAVAETIVPPELREAHRRGLARFLPTGEGPALGKRIEMTALRADGTQFPVELSISVSRVHGHPPFFTAYLRDLTERKRAEQALAKAQAELETHAGKLEETVADRTAKLRETIGELEAFSYSISHDMRAPLRAMTAYAEAMKEDFSKQLPAPATNYLNNITSAATRMDQLITDVLAYSRIARGPRHLEPVELEPLIAEIVSHYPSLQAPHADVKIQPPLPTVLGDQPSLAQCLSNLLTNAVKFVAPGVKPAVRVWSEPVITQEPATGQDSSLCSPGSTHTFIRLYLEDNGIGIAEQDLHRIFGMFERVHAQASYEGTGIGLAIVKKAVERMGGHVGVESTPGQGSRFWLQLRKA